MTDILVNELSCGVVDRSGLHRLKRNTDYQDPPRFTDFNLHFRKLMQEISTHNASDIFIQEGSPITVAIEGLLFAATWRIIDGTEAQWLLSLICGQTALAIIANKQAINTTFSLFDADEKKLTLTGRRALNNFRVNASAIRLQGETRFQITMRTIPANPPTYKDIGLPLSFVQRCCPNKGIVIVSGATGEGKSTSLAAIIRYILEENTSIRGNIISHEDPIEFVYDNIVSAHSIVAQSQIPECFATFHDANREAMRRKPAAILIGELRDRETIVSAVEASLTGHPVFATVHASSVTAIIQRILTQFSIDEKNNALFNLLDTSVMFVSQRLIPKVDGKRMAVREYLYFSNEIRDELLRIDDPLQVNRRIMEIMANGSDDENAIASKTFAQQGEDLLKKGIIGQAGYDRLRTDK